MAASASVTVRDDGGARSLSTNERDFLRSCALASSGKVLRGDGRGPGEVRKIQLTLGRSHNGAECTVQWGTGTRVTSHVTGTLIPPSPDRPSEGTVSLSVDLSPMASTSFMHAQPVTTTPGMSSTGELFSVTDEAQKLLSNRILRALERSLLIGGALDTEALCVQSGAWVWRLHVSITVLDHGGNLLDASVLAAVASLRHYRKPQVELNASDTTQNSSSPTMIHSDMREPTPLPLHHTPLSISFALIHADDGGTSASSSTVAALVDPTDREELVQTGCISLAMNVHSEVCLVDFGGGCELKPEQLKRCWKLAEKSILQLCAMLETTLTQADRKAHEERLQRLQQGQAETTPVEGVPFVQDSTGQDFMEIDTVTEFKDVAGDIESAANQVQQDEQEEAYRLQALDYALGHVAAKVKDNDGGGKPKRSTAAASNNKPGSLLAAMLQSAQSANDVPVQDAKGTHDGDDLRSKDAQDEFAQFAAKAAKTTTSASEKQTTIPMESGDDDEEETTTMLQSEFQSIPQPATPTTTPAPATRPPANKDDDDIDDLAMAIKKKKKKSKKK